MWTSRWGLMHITVLLYIFSDCPWFIQLLNYSKGEFHKIGKKSLSAPLINRLKWLCKMFIYSRLKTRKNEAFFCNFAQLFIGIPAKDWIYKNLLKTTTSFWVHKIWVVTFRLENNMIFELEAKGIGLCTTCVHYYCFPMYIFKDKFLQ